MQTSWVGCPHCTSPNYKRHVGSEPDYEVWYICNACRRSFFRLGHWVEQLLSTEE